MARKTKRTIRKTPSPLARELIRLGNDADGISRRAHRLAEKVRELERDSVPTSRLRVDAESGRFYVED